MVNFSIIIPTYNRTHLIKRAINSALSNIADGDEILVIDDGSVEDYSQVLEEYDPSIVKYKKIVNAGVSSARNYGLEIAQNNFIAFLDDDDQWYENHLEAHRLVYKHRPDLAGIFCNFDNTLTSGEKLSNGIARWSKGMPQIQQLLDKVRIADKTAYIGEHYKNQLSMDYILPSSFSFNIKICGNKDRFQIGLNRNQSWLFNSHICCYGPVAYIDDITCMQHGDAEIRNTGISYFETVMSMLFVIAKEWGSNKDFYSKNKKRYDDIRFQRYLSAFKIVIKEMSAKKMLRLTKLVGLYDSLRYSIRAIYTVIFK